MIDFNAINSELEQVVLVAVKTPDLTEAQVNEHLDELAFLTETAGAVPVKRFVQNLHKKRKKLKL